MTSYIEKLVYFFSCFFLLNTGFIFTLPLFFKTKEEYDKIKIYIFGNSLHVYGGVLGIIISAMLCFFSVENIMVIGDLLPASTIFINSVMLLFGYIRISKYLNQKMIKKGDDILTSLQIPIGLFSIVTGIIHVFFNNIIIL